MSVLTRPGWICARGRCDGRQHGVRGGQRATGPWAESRATHQSDGPPAVASDAGRATGDLERELAEPLVGGGLGGRVGRGDGRVWAERRQQARARQERRHVDDLGGLVRPRARLEHRQERQRRQDRADEVGVDVDPQLGRRHLGRRLPAGRHGARNQQQDVDRRVVGRDERDVDRRLDGGLRKRAGREGEESALDVRQPQHAAAAQGSLAGGRTAMLSSDVTSSTTVWTLPSLELTSSCRAAELEGSRAAATTRASGSCDSWRTVSRPMPLQQRKENAVSSKIDRGARKRGTDRDAPVTR